MTASWNNETCQPRAAAGETSEQLIAAYPQLNVEDLRACLEYAAALAADEVVLTEA